MKLKYYLRGLGIGMLVAALVLVLSGNTRAKMSDEEVKRRATQLGMVEKDKTVLGDIDSKASAENETADGLELPEEEPAAAGEENANAPTEQAEGLTGTEENQNPEETGLEQGEQPQQDGEASELDEGEAALAREIEQKADEVADRAKEVAENAVSGRVITLEVRQGDNSVSVARRAAEAGLVQSAADFDVFLCQNGYDKRISIGSYEITEGASEKEIADVITKSR